MKGIVTGILTVSMKAGPSKRSKTVKVCSALDVLRINANKSKEYWYYACTRSGVEGYIPKKYITVKEAHS